MRTTPASRFGLERAVLVGLGHVPMQINVIYSAMI